MIFPGIFQSSIPSASFSSSIFFRSPVDAPGTEELKRPLLSTGDVRELYIDTDMYKQRENKGG